MKDNCTINSWLSKEECSALRTIAILAIVVHNFAHKLPGSAVENEFAFNIDNSQYFWNNIFSSDFFIHLFSFWGHLGVPIFVFLSAYGLSLKYGDKETINWKQFLFSHYKKLFIPLLFGSSVYLVIMYINIGESPFSIARFVTQCTMILNLLYPHELNMSPGPYWYFGMTMQLYVLYIFIVYKKDASWLLGLTLLSIVFLASLYNNYQLLVWSKCNIIGWIIPFALGIWSIKYNYLNKLFSNNIRKIVTLMFSAIFLCIFGNYYFLWIFIPAVVVCLGISFIKTTSISIWKQVNAIGANSMYIFVIHPIIRDIMLPLVPNMGKYGAMGLYVALTLIIAYFVSQLVKRVKYH